MAQVKVFGYSDKISVKPGEVIQFHVNADGTEIAEAQLVRLIHGDEHPSGPGFIEEEIDCAGERHVEGRKAIYPGRVIPRGADPERRLALDGSLTLFAFIHPTCRRSGFANA